MINGVSGCPSTVGRSVALLSSFPLFSALSSSRVSVTAVYTPSRSVIGERTLAIPPPRDNLTHPQDEHRMIFASRSRTNQSVVARGEFDSSRLMWSAQQSQIIPKLSPRGHKAACGSAASFATMTLTSVP